ncbi:MAG TPA: hypothetical protein VFX50_18900 [Gemmatimonadales bacterium]|nr:hypothetical protein [Gemmatimonadales bacterium]
MRDLMTVAALAGAALSASPLMAQTSLTIYNDGRVLVRRTVEATVPKGASRQTLALGQIEPGSLVSLDPDVAIVGTTYDGDVSMDRALRRMVGRQVTVERPQPGGGYETFKATVLGVDPFRFRLPDGTVAFDHPGGQMRFPEDAVAVTPTVAAAVQSASAKKGLRLGWFTDGAAWRAGYDVILDKAQARVSGRAVLESSALAVQDAEVQLLAGSVSRAPQPSPKARRGVAQEMMAQAAPIADYAGEQRAGEFHLYTLPGRLTLQPGQATTVALFEPATAGYEKRLVVRSAMPFWGFVPQMPEEQPVPVEVSYSVKRGKGAAFGETPLPGGVARIFTADAEGRHQMIGEATVGHTPAGAEWTLGAGEAFDVTAKRTQTDYNVVQEKVKGAVRSTATIGWKVTLANATDTAAVVDVREERGGEWSVIASSVPAEKLAASVTRFRVTVPARGSVDLTYTLRAIW